MNNINYTISDKVSWKEMDGLVVIVNIETGAYYSLNITASAIWQLTVQGKNITEISQAVTEKYEIAQETLDKDIKSCHKYWLGEALISQMTLDSDKPNFQ